MTLDELSSSNTSTINNKSFASLKSNETLELILHNLLKKMVC